MMEKPFVNEIAEGVEFNAVNQPPGQGVRIVGNPNENNMTAEVRQPAKITMNIPHFQLGSPHKVTIAPSPTPTSPLRAGLPTDCNPRTIFPTPGFQIPKTFAPNSYVASEKESIEPQTPVSVPRPMQLDPGVLASFRSSPSVIQPLQPVDAGSSMINRFRSQPQQASHYYVPHPNNQFPNYPLPTRPQTIQFPDAKHVISSMASLIPVPLTRPSVSLTVCKNPVDVPTPILEIQQQQFIEVGQSSPVVSQSVPLPPVVTTPAASSSSSPTMVMLNDGVSITSMSTSASNLTSSLANAIPQTMQFEITTILPNNDTNPVPSISSCSGLESSPTTTPSVTAKPNPSNPTNMNTMTPIVIHPDSNTTIPTSDREPSPDKTLGKLRGPKCYRQPEHRSGSNTTEVSLSLGPYQRPTKVPLKLKCNDIRREDIAMLVMPSEDWSCSVYPTSTNNRHTKYIYVISETLLNLDLVEIVRKSISIQPNWGMKFSVMATDATKFNLGLDASDISDIQAILDNFDSFPICNGVGDVTDPKALQFSETKVTLYSDKRIRCKECPLVLVNLSDKRCTSCLKLLNSSKN